MSKTITLPLRKVIKKLDGYIVCELEYLIGEREVWKDVSKPYAHSTSAFAALGRLVQKDTLAA